MTELRVKTHFLDTLMGVPMGSVGTLMGVPMGSVGPLMGVPMGSVGTLMGVPMGRGPGARAQAPKSAR